MIKKEVKNILRNKHLIIQIHSMTSVKAKVIPVLTGATGTTSKSLQKYLSNIPGKHEMKELGNAHTHTHTHTSETTNVKVQKRFIMG